MKPWVAWNFLCRSGWFWTHRVPPKGVHHRSGLDYSFNIWEYFFRVEVLDSLSISPPHGLYPFYFTIFFIIHICWSKCPWEAILGARDQIWYRQTMPLVALPAFLYWSFDALSPIKHLVFKNISLATKTSHQWKGVETLSPWPDSFNDRFWASFEDFHHLFRWWNYWKADAGPWQMAASSHLMIEYIIIICDAWVGKAT